MAVLTVRNLPGEVHRALRVRAAEHGTSTEAEVRAILAAAAVPEQRIRLGDAIVALGRETELTSAEAALVDADVDAIDALRDRTPPLPLTLP